MYCFSSFRSEAKDDLLFQPSCETPPVIEPLNFGLDPQHQHLLEFVSHFSNFLA